MIKQIITISMILLSTLSFTQEWKVISLASNQTLSDTTLYLTLSGGTVIDTLDGGYTLFDTTGVNAIAPINYGDTYELRFDFTVKQLGNNGQIKVTIDIGTEQGPIDIVSARTDVGKDFEPISLPLPVYSLSTFITNGGKVKIELKGSFEFSAMGIYLLRTSNAEEVENGKRAIVNTPASAVNLNQSTETIVGLGSLSDPRGLGITVSNDTIYFPNKPGVYTISMFPELVKNPDTGSLNIATEFTLYLETDDGVNVIAVQSKDLLNDSNNFLTFSRIVFIEGSVNKLWMTSRALGLTTRDVEFVNANSKLFQIAKLK